MVNNGQQRYADRLNDIKQIEADLFDAIEILKTKKSESEKGRLNKKIDILSHRYSTYKLNQAQ